MTFESLSDFFIKFTLKNFLPLMSFEIFWLFLAVFNLKRDFCFVFCIFLFFFSILLLKCLFSFFLSFLNKFSTLFFKIFFSSSVKK